MPLNFYNFLPVKLLKRKSPKKSMLFIQSEMLELEKLKFSKGQSLIILNLLKFTKMTREFLEKVITKKLEERKRNRMIKLKMKQQTLSIEND